MHELTVTRAGDADCPPEAPILRIVRGNPTTEEVAALVTVLLARAGDGSNGLAREPRSAWADPARALHARSRDPRTTWLVTSGDSRRTSNMPVFMPVPTPD
jgi:Acyl-CoA carboxylase epsilon subunit